MANLPVSCVLCGCAFSSVDIFDPDEGPNDPDRPEYDGAILSEEQTEWLRNFRAITGVSATEVALSSLATSPLGGLNIVISDDDAIFDSFRVLNYSYERKVFRRNEKGDALYPLHTSCLHIFDYWCHHQSLVGAHSMSDVVALYVLLSQRHTKDIETVMSMSFYDLLTANGSGLEWAHGYYGARNFWGPVEWVSSEGWEWLCADPVNLPSLTSWVITGLHPIDAQLNLLSPSDHKTKPTSSSISALPFELLAQIIAYLPTSSTLRLRRCSRHLSLHIPLSQVFWREELLLGALIPYLWDLDKEVCRSRGEEWDWKRLAMQLKGDNFGETPSLDFSHGYDKTQQKKLTVMTMRGISTLADEPLGFRNRRRIWRMLEDIEAYEAKEMKE